MMQMLEWVCSWFKGLSHVDLGKVEMMSNSRRRDLGYFEVDRNRWISWARGVNSCEQNSSVWNAVANISSLSTTAHWETFAKLASTSTGAGTVRSWYCKVSPSRRRENSPTTLDFDLKGRSDRPIGGAWHTRPLWFWNKFNPLFSSCEQDSSWHFLLRLRAVVAWWNGPSDVSIFFYQLDFFLFSFVF